jgi:hypothetical protein
VADLPATIPAPGTLSHRRYGERLKVPAVDLYAPATSLHLWYVVETPRLLHHLLADVGVAVWGELKSLAGAGGTPLLEAGELARIAIAAEVAASALERLRVGRGRPVDRRALLASGAITDRFIDEVDVLCRRVGGDAELLVEQLEARVIPNFLQRNAGLLREYLEQEGFLDLRDPPRLEVVRRGLIAEHAAAIADGILSYDAIDRLLQRLAAGAGCLPAVPAPTVQRQLFPDITD